MANVYRTRKDIFDGIESYKVYTSSGMSTGSMAQWDSNARLATPMTTASGAIFLGINEDAQPLAGLGSSTNPLTGDRTRIKGQGIFEMKTTASEVYSHLDPVWMGADDQTVTKLGASRMVGRVHLPDGSQVTGATGTTVMVRIIGNLGAASVLPSAASTSI